MPLAHHRPFPRVCMGLNQAFPAFRRAHQRKRGAELSRRPCDVRKTSYGVVVIGAVVYGSQVVVVTLLAVSVYPVL